MTFNQHLKKLREDENLTQEELSLRLNISRSAIAKWEQGKGMPSLELLKSLALFFHTSIDSLLGEEGVNRLEKRQNRKFVITSLIAVSALIIATLSTTLLIINRNNVPMTTTKVIVIDSLNRLDGKYQIQYVENETTKTFDINADDVFFRNQREMEVQLSPQDYIEVEFVGNKPTKVMIIDNKNEVSLRGYELNFFNDDSQYNFYYHEFLNTDNDVSYFTSASNITSFENTHISILGRQYDDVFYQQITINQILAVDKTFSNYHSFNLNEIYMPQDNVPYTSTIGNYSSGLLSHIDFTVTGYLNSYSHIGTSYIIRDIITYDVTVDFVETVESIRVKEFDDFNNILNETTLNSQSDLSSFNVGSNASYIKYYIGDDIRGKTIEIGDEETIYFSTNTPLPMTYNLKIK